MPPKISVITPAFNAASTIERAIKSVLAQNYPNTQHVVIDGGSTDGSFDILKKYEHLKWISERDQGQSDAMNKGFDLSNGELIVYLNADDEFAPGVFQQVANFYEQNRSEKFMLLMDLEVKEANGLVWTAVPSLAYHDVADPGKMLFPYNPLSYFYHRKLQESTGKFPVNLKYAMDYWFLLRVYRKADLHYKPFIAGTFYNIDNKASDKSRSQKEALDVLISYMKSRLPVLYLLHPFVLKAKRIKARLRS